VTAKTNTFDYRESHINPGRGAAYDRLYRHGTALDFYWRHFERPYLDALFHGLHRKYPHGRYLDFACGTGRLLELGASRFEACVGIDVSQSMLVKARHKVPQAHIVQADVLTTPVDVGTFDVVTLFRFLLRAGPDLREGVLRWLRGVIKDDGTLIVNNHRNAYSMRGLVYRVASTIRPDGFEHELLTDQQVEALLRRCGFRIVDRFGFGMVPSLRGRLLLPEGVLLPLERRASRSAAFDRVAKNRIYVCRPIPVPTAAN
jgi:ubiquinone/menaquinone biosynthesis C-methylase UbiE